VTKRARFTQAEIVRAIKGFERAGVRLAALKVALDGSITLVAAGDETADDDWRIGSPLYADKGKRR
jgi:hypothetical protein